MTGWTALIVAGLFEVAFTTCLKLSNGFTRWVWATLFVVSAVSSFALLAVAMRTIPLGTAYAVWTGIGAVGTAVVGMAFFRDPTTTWRLVFLVLLIGSIVGLKVVTPDPAPGA